MTGSHANPQGRRRLGVSLPVVLGRLRADGWPLALALVVVVVSAALATAVPRLMAVTADDAVRHAVELAGSAAELEVSRTIDWDPSQPRTLQPELARASADVARTEQDRLTPSRRRP